MRNIKIEKSLIGPEWWKSTFLFGVKGDPKAVKLHEGMDQEEKEKIIQSWKSIAVLELEPRDIRACIGFVSGTYLGFLRESIETLEGRFGMRVGNDDVQFFVFDKNFEREVRLKLVEITNEDDTKYNSLPLY